VQSYRPPSNAYGQAGAATTPVFTVAALISTFESDNAMANQRLKGKVLYVRDVVEKVGKHDVSLRNPAKNTNSVKCKFGAESRAPIEVGSTVLVQGTLDKRGFTGDIGLNQCVIVTAVNTKPTAY
jgi:hypothetical protein